MPPDMLLSVTEWTCWDCNSSSSASTFKVMQYKTSSFKKLYVQTDIRRVKLQTVVEHRKQTYFYFNTPIFIIKDFKSSSWLDLPIHSFGSWFWMCFSTSTVRTLNICVFMTWRIERLTSMIYVANHRIPLNQLFWNLICKDSEMNRWIRGLWFGP